MSLPALQQQPSMTVRAAAESKRNFFMVNPLVVSKEWPISVFETINIIKFLEDIPVNNGFFSNSFPFPMSEGIPVFLPNNLKLFFKISKVL